MAMGALDLVHLLREQTAIGGVAKACAHSIDIGAHLVRGRMEKETGNILGLPPALAAVVAVVADGLIIAFIVRALQSDYVDAVPFVVLVTACLVNALNLTLILLRRKLQRQIFRALGLIAIVGSVALLLALGLVGVLGLALIGGGGNASGAQMELMALVAVIAAIIVLNIVLIQRASMAGPT